MFRLAFSNFVRIRGTQQAAAFAHYALFSFFPLLILLVAIASVFVDRERAEAEIVAYVQTHIPIDQESHRFVTETINGVIATRGKAGGIAVLMLGWAASLFLTTLIRATNLAWGDEVSPWWRLRLKSMGGLPIIVLAALLGIAAPVLATMAKSWVLSTIHVTHGIETWARAAASVGVPFGVMFFSLSLFYRLAPRRQTRFGEIWFPALCATALLLATGTLFSIYFSKVARLNAVYGTFGVIMAVLLWIYISGCIFIFGACLCAAQAGNKKGA